MYINNLMLSQNVNINKDISKFDIKGKSTAANKKNNVGIKKHYIFNFIKSRFSNSITLHGFRQKPKTMKTSR